MPNLMTMHIARYNEKKIKKIFVAILDITDAKHNNTSSYDPGIIHCNIESVGTFSCDAGIVHCKIGHYYIYS